MRHTCARVLVVAAIAGLLLSPATTASITAQGPPSPARYKGLTSGEWAAAWWQAVFATPVEAGTHPLITGGAIGGNNRAVFLAGPVTPAGSPRVTIPVTIPAGTTLIVPIITVECSVAEDPPFHGEDEVELRACANGLLDLVSDPQATIDGAPLSDPGTSRVESPLFRYGPCRLITSWACRQEHSPTPLPRATSLCFHRSTRGCTASPLARACLISVLPPTRRSSSTSRRRRRGDVRQPSTNKGRGKQ